MSFKFIKLESSRDWLGTCSYWTMKEKLTIMDIQKMFPEIVIYKFEYFDESFVDFKFYIESEADEASFILKAHALQEQK